MKKLLASLLAVTLLAGCGAQGSDEAADKTITVGASTTPHAEILKEIQPTLEEQGYELKIIEFTDYVKPNQSLVAGELDANFFQHKPYMVEWAEKNDATDQITDVLSVHFEPMGIYTTKHKSLDELAKGMKISIPNDPTNGGRALRLLADNGIIKLSKDEGIDVTKNDIVKNDLNIEIIEMNAETCAVTIDDVDYSVLNGNNALVNKLDKNVLVTEDKESDAAKTYGNVIAIRPELKDEDKIKALLDALNSEEVSTFIEETYDGIVVPLVPAK